MKSVFLFGLITSQIGWATMIFSPNFVTTIDCGKVSIQFDAMKKRPLSTNLTGVSEPMLKYYPVFYGLQKSNIQCRSSVNYG
jgi:hypothetical protein